MNEEKENTRPKNGDEKTELTFCAEPSHPQQVTGFPGMNPPSL